MRRVAVLAIVLGCGAAAHAGAQTLMTPISGTSDRDAAALADAAFAPKAPLDNDGIGRMLDREVVVAGQGPVRWTTGETRLSGASSSGAVDSLRIGMGGVLRTPGGAPLALNSAGFQPNAYEVTVVRDWPSAVSFGAGKIGIDVSPHAGVGMTSSGAAAEAGARMELSRRRDDAAVQRLKDLGVRDGAAFGDRGRWYLYAAASGRAVGLNMLHNDSGWDRAGWTTDPTSTLIGDAQLGIGWRKGIVQTSFGYLHREVKGQHMIFGQETREDSLLAFTLSIKPPK
jgi:hypothetical protein